MSLHHWFNPGKFQRFLQKLLPLTAILCVITGGIGLYQALYASPPDYQQGETVRMMYVHVPAAWMALFVYTTIGMLGIAHLVWKNPLSSLMAVQATPIGTGFALICLITGSLWGKPMWGSFWVWDARLTSMLILFFFYVALLALYQAYENKEHAAKVTSILAIVGLVNVPIVKFSVEWWHTLHRPASLLRKGGIAIDPAMLSPLLWMAGFYLCFFLCIWNLRIQAALWKKKLHSL